MPQPVAAANGEVFHMPLWSQGRQQQWERGWVDGWSQHRVDGWTQCWVDGWVDAPMQQCSLAPTVL